MTTSLVFLEVEHWYLTVPHDIPEGERDFIDQADYESKWGKLGDSQPLLSVTTLVGQFEHHFDAESVIEMMFKDSQTIYDGSEIYAGKNVEYQGCTREEVLQLWDIKREKACRYGTWVHKEAEEYTMGNRPEWDNKRKKHRPEFTQVRNYFETSGQSVVEAEIRVYDDEFKMAGTLDLLCKDKEGKYWVVDWKTNADKDLSDMVGTHFTKSMLKPIGNLKDLPYWHYALQFSIYRYLMEKNEGMEFAGQAAVHIKRDGTEPEVIFMPYLKAEVLLLLEMRRRELEEIRLRKEFDADDSWKQDL